MRLRKVKRGRVQTLGLSCFPPSQGHPGLLLSAWQLSQGGSGSKGEDVDEDEEERQAAGKKVEVARVERGECEEE